jgi:glycosyltransferase involved in cell wall biosynthesis
MLFDLEFTGHHANYIRYIINYWGQSQSKNTLTIVVSPEFVLRHHEILEQIRKDNLINISFQEILPQEAKLLNTSSRIGRALRRIREWRLLCKYARALNADHCLVMYIDKLQLPVILGLRSPCPISGIYFQPSFHYKKISIEKQNKNQKSSSLFTWKDIRDYVFLQKANLHPQIIYLFTLDPYAVKYIQENFKGFDCIHLPDPVEQIRLDIPDNIECDISNSRVSLLIFGSLDERKGISKILDALEALHIETCKKICIFFVGQLHDSMKNYLPSRIKYLTEKKDVKFVCDFSYVSEETALKYFRKSDFILALYQKHIGMSGILLLSAAAQKPVISQSYGLMGKLVNEYRLGMTVDSTQVNEISRTIEQIISGESDCYCDQDKMFEFVQINSAKKFSRTIVDKIIKLGATK